METTRHTVNLSYTREELNALFALANAEDAENYAGRYDTQGAAINVWVRNWAGLIGTFHINWLSNDLWLIELAEGSSLDDLLYELAMLELKALGRVKHGKRRRS